MGQLARVLPDSPVPPLPAFLSYPQNKQLSPRVRVVIEWIVATLATSVTTEASANA
jgi:DNA-binding transcriptional LysR family regulator